MNIPLFRLNPLAAGLNLSASLKADASNKEIEEAMKRVREAQSLISAAIEPGSKCTKAALQCSAVTIHIFIVLPFKSNLIHCTLTIPSTVFLFLQIKRAKSAPGPGPEEGDPDHVQDTGDD